MGASIPTKGQQEYVRECSACGQDHPIWFYPDVSATTHGYTHIGQCDNAKRTVYMRFVVEGET